MLPSQSSGPPQHPLTQRSAQLGENEGARLYLHQRAYFWRGLEKALLRTRVKRHLASDSSYRRAAIWALKKDL